MKYIYITVLVLLTSIVYSQEPVHWLINQDKNTDCNFIKSGKFVNEGVGGVITKGYTIEFRGNTVIEKIEGGKYYLKSRITYTSKCSYKLKVLETTIPGYEEVIGKTFYTEILETAKVDNLVKIRSKGEEWQVLVLKKIEE
jgi:hypothetical protein